MVASRRSSRSRRSRAVWLWALLPLLALAALAGFLLKQAHDERVYQDTYITVHGMELRRDSRDLDLRKQPLSTEDYTDFRSAFPDAHIRWTVPLSGGGQDSDALGIRISRFSEADIPLLDYLPDLAAVNADGCDDYPALLALREARPDLRLSWTVNVAGTAVRDDREHLVLPAAAADRDLGAMLSLLPSLRSVRFTGGPVDWETQDHLRQTLPDVEFRWDTALCGQVVPAGTKKISFAGQALTEEDLDTIRRNAFRFPELTRLDLTDCGFDRETLLPLARTLPGVTVVWTMDLYGLTVSTDAVEIDLSRRPVRDGAAAIEDALPCFPLLEKVIMTRCGLNNEEMDALDRRHEDVRFVWTVFFSIYSLRTDATNFIAARFVNDAELYSNECRVLKYCPDLIALDLGHKNLTDLSFLYDLPKLQYLILVENDHYDITPIGSLQDLKYLEIFWTKVENISPLINCKKLEDLNICYIYSRPKAAFDVLMQMPWLQRLWYCGNGLTDEQIEQLQANMPACEMYMEKHGEATGGTWREHPHYFEMRDVFEMYYMPGGTNGVDDSGHQIVVRG